MKGVVKPKPHPTRPLIDNQPRTSAGASQRRLHVFDRDRRVEDLAGTVEWFRLQSFADDSFP